MLPTASPSLRPRKPLHHRVLALFIRMHKLQMKSINHQRWGHLRRYLIFQSIKASKNAFTLALENFSRCVRNIKNPQTIGLVKYFPPYFRRVFNRESSVNDSQVYFYSNWWFRRVTENLTCTKQQRERVASGKYLDDRLCSASSSMERIKFNNV